MIINEREYNGLTSKEVEERIDKGLINHVDNNHTKSIKQILKDNICTFFNFINIVLLAMVILVGSFKNSLFIFIIIINTVAGIYQEIKAKITLDKMSVIIEKEISIIRNGELIHKKIEEIVQDDLIVLVSGNQVPTDCVLIDGHMEANESLLTGESDAVLKSSGDSLFSGSFITSGRGICKVTKVGEESYISKISAEAKTHQKYDSQLNKYINQILKVISIIIIPVGVLLFIVQHFISGSSFQSAIVSTVAALLGMIPEGLVLLTSVALTISVLKLAKENTLVQELYCIETLARVDTLCLDKTGTLTKGDIVVEKDISLTDTKVSEIIGNMLSHLEDTNVTSVALKEHYPTLETYKPYFIIPFSSERKYSAVSFENIGTYYLGAYQFIFPNGNEHIASKVKRYTNEGFRVIVIGFSKEIVNDNILAKSVEPVGLIILSDVMRDNVKDTLKYFSKEGVDIKIISGDDPVTVSAIAKKAGVHNYDKYADASTINSDEEMHQSLKENVVFGRVSPQQKKLMVQLLKKDDRVVAMTGDGVNDILAFKQADCSIAMASGSDAAKSTANIVLLDNDFNSMPSILNEGRRVINNISRSSSMFLIKTIFSVIISIATILLGQIYPFKPIQLSLISACCVGIPTFFLTYENDFSKVSKNFFDKVFKISFPYALNIAVMSVIIIKGGTMLNINEDDLSTLCLLLAGWNNLLALLRIYSPLNNYRKLVIGVTQVMYYVALLLFSDFFYLSLTNHGIACLIPVVFVLSHLLYNFNLNLYKKIRNKYTKIKS